RRHAQSTSGRRSSQRTFPSVRRSMAGQCSAGTFRPGCFHWLTAAFVTRSSPAKATCEPTIWAASSIGWMFMSGFPVTNNSKYRNSIYTSQDILDPSCKVSLYHEQMEINKWVKTARTHAKLTQEKLAEILEVTKGNVSAWENGRHEPSWTQMKKISLA